MKKTLFLIFLSLFLYSCGDDDIKHDPRGGLNQKCYTGGVCDGDLICNGENICSQSNCEGVDCGEYGECVVENLIAVCSCQEGYIDLNLQCVEESVVCDGVNCSDHGECTVFGGEAICRCDEGYQSEGLSCVSICSDVDCGEYGECVILNGDAVCECDEGYHSEGLSCVENSPEDPCLGVTCSNIGVCYDNEGVPACNCPEGYIVEGLTCIEQTPCYGVICSNHGECDDESGVAICNCDEGYHAEGLNCIENSVEDPCLGVNCSNHGECVVSDGAPICNCDSGYNSIGADCIEDLCYQIDCSGYGECIVSEGSPNCNCYEGYIAEGLLCVPFSGCTDSYDCAEKEWCSDGECICQSGFIKNNGVCEVEIIPNPDERTAELTCQKYNNDYPERAESPILDEGSQTCDPGVLHWEAIDDAVRRVNLYRWMAKLNPVYSTLDYNQTPQQCAVMMDANNSLSHNPPENWDCYSEGGAQAAGQSNIGLGYYTPASTIDGYVRDSGTPSLGHRRWLFNSVLGKIGIGHHHRGNCTKVFDWSGSSPEIINVPYPAPGYYPFELIRGDWSFSIFNTNFGTIVSVIITDLNNNTTLDNTATILPNGYGPDTISISFNSDQPQAGHSYQVDINWLDTMDYEYSYSYITHLINCSSY